MILRRHKETLAIGGILAAGAVLRIWGLSDWPLSIDNTLLADHSAGTSFRNLFHVIKPLSHPPLMYFLCGLALKLSASPLFLRTLSLVPGILMILTYYLIGKRFLGGRAAGFFMAAVVMTNYHLVVQSQILRMYSILLFLQSLMLLSLIDCDVKRRRRCLIVYFACALLSLFQHFAAPIVIAPLALVWFDRIGKQDRSKRAQIAWVVGHAALALVFLVLVLWNDRTIPAYWSAYSVRTRLIQGWWDFGQRLWDIPRFFFFPEGSAISHLMIWPMLAGLFALWREKKRRVLALIAGVFAVNIVFSLMGLYPFYHGRHCLHLLLFLLLPAAFAFQYAWDHVTKPSYAALVGLFLVLLAPNLFGGPARVQSPDSYRHIHYGNSPDFPGLTTGQHRRTGEWLGQSVERGDAVFAFPATLTIFTAASMRSILPEFQAIFAPVSRHSILPEFQTILEKKIFVFSCPFPVIRTNVCLLLLKRLTDRNPPKTLWIVARPSGHSSFSHRFPGWKPDKARIFHAGSEILILPYSQDPRR